jgi:hypothetical protein
VDNTVELTLQKVEGMHWWKSVMQGDEEIDVQVGRLRGQGGGSRAQPLRSCCVQRHAALCCAAQRARPRQQQLMRTCAVRRRWNQRTAS